MKFSHIHKKYSTSGELQHANLLQKRKYNTWPLGIVCVLLLAGDGKRVLFFLILFDVFFFFFGSFFSFVELETVSGDELCARSK